MRENNGKHTVGPNEFTDFEQFALEHIDRIKTILATKPITPVTALLYKHSILRVM